MRDLWLHIPVGKGVEDTRLSGVGDRLLQGER